MGSSFTSPSYAGRTANEHDDSFEPDPSEHVKKQKLARAPSRRRHAPPPPGFVSAAPPTAADTYFANVGECYQEALADAHVAQDEGKSDLYRSLLFRAAKGQDVAAMFELLLNIKDRADAEAIFPARLRQLFEAAANPDDALALNNLGYVYKRGLGGPVDLAGAFRAYLGSVRLGNPVGFFNLALMLINGDYLPVDLKKAENLLLRAAAHGLEAAQLALAHYYLKGAFGIVDIDKAQAYLEQAAANGSEEAKNQLRIIADMRNEQFQIGADDMLIPVFDIDDEAVRLSIFDFGSI